MKNIVRYANREDYGGVRDFFDSIDDDFYPIVSEREGGLEQYLQKPEADGKIAIFERNNELVGACAYWFDGNTAIVEIIGIAKKYRKSPVVYRLIQYMVQQESNAPVKKVRAQTWSTNEDSRNLLEPLGFRIIKKIEGDMVPDRTTLLYEANLKDIKEFFGINSEPAP